MQQLSDATTVTEQSISTPAAGHPAKAQQPAKTKRGGLTKPNRAPPGSRSAETAIPAAGYGAQHRKLNDEFSHVGGSSSSGSGSFGAEHAANGVLGSAPSISVGQVVDARALQAYGGNAGPSRTTSVGSAYGNYLSGESYDETVGGGSTSDTALGNRRVSPQLTAQRVVSGGGGARRGTSTDEHAWLGSGGSGKMGQGRRSPGTEDRRSDPSADLWKAEGGSSAIEGWNNHTATAQRPYRSSDPPRGTEALMDKADERTMSTSSSGKSLNSLLSTSSGDRSGEESGFGSLGNGNDVGILPIMGSGSSAMLDAARKSQSRRR